MKNIYVIRECNKKDINRIVDLWIRNQYFKETAPLELKKHLIWKYNHRFTKVWVAEAKQNIIGTCGKITYPLIINGRGIINGNWGIDLLADKRVSIKNRNFIFFRVFRNALLGDYREGNKFLDFSFPSETVKDTFLKIGWINVPIFQKFTKYIFYDSHKKITICKNFSFGGIKFLKIKKFNSEWDNILRKICSRYALINLRDANYLNWRYSECPDKKYYILLGKENNYVRGYLILKEGIAHRMKQGYIVDLFIEPDNKRLFEIFIAASIFFFRNRKINFVHFYSSNLFFKTHLLKFGFKPIKKNNFFIFGKDNKLLKQVLKNKDYWFVTSGDGDFEMES